MFCIWSVVSAARTAARDEISIVYPKRPQAFLLLKISIKVLYHINTHFSIPESKFSTICTKLLKRARECGILSVKSTLTVWVIMFAGYCRRYPFGILSGVFLLNKLSLRTSSGTFSHFSLLGSQTPNNKKSLRGFSGGSGGNLL